MQFSTLVLAAISAIGASASGFCEPGRWTIFSGDVDDVVEGFPAFGASCIAAGYFSCRALDGASYISFNTTFGLGPGNWTFMQQYDGRTAIATIDRWSPTQSLFTYLTPTLVA
ncbi:hypothetical protein O1611_g856 [Lasiodiplodia mahajangana]|uniref:Uncharacterized protein n=1 Tax=Lasiodiplodia mahajangana TaxID=1108764 RepID=A0ACC2JZP9_9PEZI|nr:hypothetical protein O1611_g856 [Lasiodiplodia mahajangana]